MLCYNNISTNINVIIIIIILYMLLKLTKIKNTIFKYWLILTNIK